MALYTVRTALISWTGEAERLVELSDKEAKELEVFFKKERLENRLYGYRIAPAVVRSLKDIREMHKSDLELEKEMAEKK